MFVPGKPLGQPLLCSVRGNCRFTLSEFLVLNVSGLAYMLKGLNHS